MKIINSNIVKKEKYMTLYKLLQIIPVNNIIINDIIFRELNTINHELIASIILEEYTRYRGLTDLHNEVL